MSPLTVGHDHGRGDGQGFVDDRSSQVYGEKDHVLLGGGLVGPVRRLEEHWLCEYGAYRKMSREGGGAYGRYCPMIYRPKPVDIFRELGNGLGVEFSRESIQSLNGIDHGAHDGRT